MRKHILILLIFHTATTPPFLWSFRRRSNRRRRGHRTRPFSRRDVFVHGFLSPSPSTISSSSQHQPPCPAHPAHPTQTTSKTRVHDRRLTDILCPWRSRRDRKRWI